MPNSVSRYCVILCLMFNSVQNVPMCEENTICLTMAAKNVLRTLIKGGVKGAPDPIDPLFQDKIVGIQETYNYTLTNATFEGIKDCEVLELSAKRNILTYQYKVHCPRLTLKSNFEVEGTLATINVVGKGELVITADDYIMQFDGIYERIISETEHKLHLVMKTHDLTTKGKLTFGITSLSSGDPKQAELATNYYNENVQSLEAAFSPTINNFMMIFIEKINDLLKVIPFEVFLKTN